MAETYNGRCIGGPYNDVNWSTSRIINRIESNNPAFCGEYRFCEAGNGGEEHWGFFYWRGDNPPERTGLNAFSDDCYNAAKNNGWWNDPLTGAEIERNTGEMFMLMVSELSEGFEGARKDKMDDHLPHRSSEEVELADLLIRVFDYAGKKGLDLQGAYREKRHYNDIRPDHKREARIKAGGKKW